MYFSIFLNQFSWKRNIFKWRNFLHFLCTIIIFLIISSRCSILLSITKHSVALLYLYGWYVCKIDSIFIVCLLLFIFLICFFYRFNFPNSLRSKNKTRNKTSEQFLQEIFLIFSVQLYLLHSDYRRDRNTSGILGSNINGCANRNLFLFSGGRFCLRFLVLSEVTRILIPGTLRTTATTQSTDRELGVARI